MKVILKLCPVLLLVVQNSFAEGVPWARVETVRVDKEFVGVEILQGLSIQDHGSAAYYEINPTSWQLKAIDKPTFDSRFSKSPEASAKHLAWGKSPSSFSLAQGETLIPEYSHCQPQEEGGPLCSEQYLRLNGQKFVFDHFVR